MAITEKEFDAMFSKISGGGSKTPAVSNGNTSTSASKKVNKTSGKITEREFDTIFDSIQNPSRYDANGVAIKEDADNPTLGVGSSLDDLKYTSGKMKVRTLENGKFTDYKDTVVNEPKLYEGLGTADNVKSFTPNTTIPILKTEPKTEHKTVTGNGNVSDMFALAGIDHSKPKTEVTQTPVVEQTVEAAPKVEPFSDKDRELINYYENALGGTNNLWDTLKAFPASFFSLGNSEYDRLNAKKREIYDDYRIAKDKSIADFIDKYAKDETLNDIEKLRKMREYGISNDDLAEYMEHQKNVADAEAKAQMTDNNGVLGFFQQPIYNLYGGLKSAAGTIYDTLSGNKVGTSRNMNRERDIAKAIGSENAKNIDNAIDNDFLSGVAQGAYNAGNTAIDMGANIALGGAVGGAIGATKIASEVAKLGSTATKILMGLGSFANKAQENAEKGVSNNANLISSLGAGLATYLSEKLGVEPLMTGNFQASTVRQAVTNFLKQGTSEGAEEGLEDLINFVTDSIVLGDKSDFRQTLSAYKQNGLSDTDAIYSAVVDTLNNTMYDIGMGFAVGGTLGGIKTIADTVAYGKPGNTETDIANNANVNNANAEVTENVANDTVVDNAPANNVPNVPMFNPNLSADEEYANAQIREMNELLNGRKVPEFHGTDEDLNRSLNEQLRYYLNQNNESANNNIVTDQVENYGGKYLASLLPSFERVKATADTSTNNKLDGIETALNKFYETNELMYLSAAEKLAHKLPVNENTQALILEIGEMLAYNEYIPTLKNANIYAPKDIYEVSENSANGYYSEDYYPNASSNVPMLNNVEETVPYRNNPLRESYVPDLSDDFSVNERKGITPKRAKRNSVGFQDIPFSITPYGDTPTSAYKPNTATNSNSTVNSTNANVNAPKTANTNTNVNGVNSVNNVNTVTNTEPEIKARSYPQTEATKTDIDKVLADEFLSNPPMYEVLHNADTSAKADDILTNNDFESALNICYDLVDKKSPESVPLAHRISNMLAQQGRYEEASRLTKHLAEKLTEAGQFTQAVVINMLNNDPVAYTTYLQRELNAMNAKGRERYGKNWKDFSLTAQDIKDFSEIKPGDKEAIKSKSEEVRKRIAKEYPSSFYEKMLELRRIDMLLNVRTNARNVVSNALLMPIRYAGDRVSALGEHAYHLFNKDYQMTNSLNPFVPKATREVTNDIWNDVKDTVLENDSKYNDLKGIERDKQVFKGSKASEMFFNAVDNMFNGAMTRFSEKVSGGKDLNPSVLETLRNFTYYLLQKGDDKFIEANFKSRMNSYLNANGITDVSQLSEEQLSQATTLAIQEAMKATFHDDNAFSNWLTGLKHSDSKTIKFITESVMPFTKTPANIAMRSVDYSPVGTVLGASDFVKAVKSGNNADISKAITRLSQGLTGSSLILLGYALAKNGIIKGALSSDNDEKEFQKSQGEQPFSFRIGNSSYTYDWAQPSAAPLIFGTILYDSMNEGSALEKAFQGTTSVIDSWFGLSPLQGLADLFDTSYGRTPGGNLLDAVSNVPLSFIPSQLGAITRIGDTTQRNTYDETTKVGTIANQAQAKIPFLSDELPARYNTWGREIKNANSTAEAAFNNLLNPGKLAVNMSEDIDAEISALHDALPSELAGKVYPHYASNSYSFDGKKVELDNETKSEYQQKIGTLSYDMASRFIKSNSYGSLADADKATILESIYKYAEYLTQKEMFDRQPMNTYKKLDKVYSQYGYSGIPDFLVFSKGINTDGSASVSQDEVMTRYRESNLPYDRKYNFALLYFTDGKDKTAREKLDAKLSEVPYLK